MATVSRTEAEALVRQGERIAWVALVSGFGGALYARRANRAALLDRLDAVLFTIVAGYYLAMAIVY